MISSHQREVSGGHRTHIEDMILIPTLPLSYRQREEGLLSGRIFFTLGNPDCRFVPMERAAGIEPA